MERFQFFKRSLCSISHKTFVYRKFMTYAVFSTSLNILKRGKKISCSWDYRQKRALIQEITLVNLCGLIQKWIFVWVSEEDEIEMIKARMTLNLSCVLTVQFYSRISLTFSIWPNSVSSYHNCMLFTCVIYNYQLWELPLISPRYI